HTLSLSRRNHRLPGHKVHPEVVQGTTDVHHQIAYVLLRLHKDRRLGNLHVRTPSSAARIGASGGASGNLMPGFLMVSSQTGKKDAALPKDCLKVCGAKW